MIVTDTISDLPNEPNLITIPSYISFNSGRYIRDCDIDKPSFITSVWNNVPNTCAPRPRDFQSLYASLAPIHDHVYSIHSSINTSSIYLKAMEASKPYDNVTVFDSGVTSAGLGAFVEEFIKTGKELEEIKENAFFYLLLSNVSHSTNSDNINRNGIHLPLNSIISMNRGKVKTVGKFNNTVGAVELLKDIINETNTNSIHISHSLFPAEVFDRKHKYPRSPWHTIPYELCALNDKTTIHEMNPTLISHFGMGAVGVGFIKQTCA